MSYDNQFYESVKEVFGHTCEGLKEFQDYGREETCSPFINKKGMVEGCDNTNDIPIKFCPFCGIELKKHAKLQDGEQ